MACFVGLDVSQKITHVCVVDGEGRVVWQGRCPSTPDAIAATVSEKAPGATRVGFESGPLSTWHYHGLIELGVPAVCVDARHAKAALSMQINKTDRNDARGLAELMRMGWYREVGVKRLDSHTVRALLGVRFQLIGMRTNIINQMRALLKTYGIILKPVFGRSQEQDVDRLCRERQGVLFETLSVLLSVYRGLKQEIAFLENLLARFVRSSPVCRLLMTIPGVGILTSAAYVSVIDDPTRVNRRRTLTPDRRAMLTRLVRSLSAGQVRSCGA